MMERSYNGYNIVYARIVVALLAITVVAASAYFLSLNSISVAEVPGQAEVVGSGDKVATAVPPTPPQYVLKDHEGNLALFVSGKTEPDILFDTPVDLLPDVDRMRLKDGITVRDYEELTRLIEDFTS